jgi:hypothetical protein
MRTSLLRRAAAIAAAALSLTGAGAAVLAPPAAANHIGAIAVSQAGSDGAYVTLQVDVTFNTSNSGAGSFGWSTGDGRNGSVSDGVSNGAYAGDASGSGWFSGGEGDVLQRFSWTRTRPASNIARTRITWAYDEAGAYTVGWSDCCPTQSGSIVVTSQASLPDCSNGIDDDGDGYVDLADPLCDSPEDDKESADCPPVAGVTVCLTPTGPSDLPPLQVQLYDPVITPGPKVVAYLETYRFTVGPVGLALPCVRLAVDTTTTSACALAGGTLTNSIPLAEAETVEPGIQPGAVLASVRVCNAELTATALGFGVTSAPALTVCESGEVSL